MVRNCSNWLRSYIEYTKHLEAPDLFHLWTGIGTVAGALRSKVWIDQYHFKWRPNFFVVLVAPPGIISKSTSVNVGIDLLRDVDGIKFGPDSMSWQALGDAFKEAEGPLPDVGNTAPITVAASELGTFFDPRNRELVDYLNDMWDGKERPFRRRTRTEGETTIERPWLNLLSCTTPGWLEEHVPPVMFKGGFMSRTVFVYQEKKRFLTAYVREKMGSAAIEFSKLRQHLLNDLKDIAEIHGEYRLTPEAIQWGKAWYERHWTEKNPHGLSKELFGPYFARKQTHIHKLAMVLAASSSNSKVIDVHHLEQAEGLVSSLEPSMGRILGSIAESSEAQRLQDVAKIFVNENISSIDKQQLWLRLMDRMSLDDFHEALRGLMAAGLVREIGTANSLRIVAQLPDMQTRYGDIEAGTYSLPESPAPEASPAENVAAHSDGGYQVE